SPADMAYVRLETTHVAGLADRSGDPSPATARGVFRALQASARHRWGSDALAGRTVALQGCGHVGYHLAAELHGAGAKLVASDYVANAGGMINGCIELLGWTRADARAKLDRIYDTILNVFQLAQAANIPTYQAADQLAERRLKN